MLTKEDLAHLNSRSLPAVKNTAERKLLKAAAVVMGEGDLPDQLSAARLTEMLSAIEPLLSTKSTIVRGYGSGWLWRLARSQEAARAKLVELYGSLNAPGRLQLIQSFEIKSPRFPQRYQTQVHLLREAFRDVSMKVRLFAAFRASNTIFTELLPHLDAAVKAETDERVLRELRTARDIIAQGYSLAEEQCRDDVRVYHIKCSYNSFGSSTEIPVALLEKVELAELVRRFRVRNRFNLTIPGGPFDPLPPGEEFEALGRWPIDWKKDADEEHAKFEEFIKSDRYKLFLGESTSPTDSESTT